MCVLNKFMVLALLINFKEAFYSLTIVERMGFSG